MAQLIAIIFLAAALGGCAARKIDAKDELDRSIGRGVEFLVKSQNRDGSWGSATLTKGLNIYAPVPGAHHGFRAATTSLCVSALLETAPRGPGVPEALDRAEIFLFSYLPRVRRGELNALYNVWAHAYAIQALVRMLERPGVPAGAEAEARRERIFELLRLQVRRLEQYEFLGGGWGYYEFEPFHFSRPAGDPNSFTTATVLIALHEARNAGVEVPQKMIERGLAEVRRQRSPNFTYHYSRNWWQRPMGEINRPAGSLGRSQACNASLRIWGDTAVTDAVLAQWLDRLFARQGWLDMGRKRPVPHESWFYVAAYFYYYGHYYAAQCIELLPADQRPRYQQMMAVTLMGHQEKDGSWFDFPFYAYHKPYGTAFALMSLGRCRDVRSLALP